MNHAPSSWGAYGFRLRYPESAWEHLSDLVELDDSAPAVGITWRYATTLVDVEEVGENRVEYGVRGATTFRVERDPPAIHFDLASAPVPAALVHPILTPGISVLARWRGDITLHAGAVELPSGAWGLIGMREAGKSAMLASLALRGYPVVADDLVTIQDGRVWAGPSCVDLRPDTAGRFEGARLLGEIGGRPRYRLSTPPGRVRVPLRGFFLLEWNDRGVVESEPLSAQERIQLLYRQEYIRLVGYPDAQKLVPILGLPAWRLSRPADWAATDEAADRLVEIANES